jgi:cytochrome P450
MTQKLDPETGRLALQSFLKGRSPLGPLRVLFERVGAFFQIPLPGFRPYVIASPEANRKLLVTDRDKVLWRNQDPVTDLLRRGVLVTDGEEHDHYRKLMEPSLHPSQLNGYAKMMQAQVERVTDKWGHGANEHRGGLAPVNILAAAEYLKEDDSAGQEAEIGEAGVDPEPATVDEIQRREATGRMEGDLLPEKVMQAIGPDD